jgi:hypothetical protein
MANIKTLGLHSFWTLALLAFLAACLGIFMTSSTYDWQGLLLVVCGTGILSVFLLPRLARGESRGFLKILIIALLLKFVFAMLNYYIAFCIYRVADAAAYDHNGMMISSYIWNLQFDKVAPFLKWSTDFISFFTGVIYSIIGPTVLGGYLVYAFLSFLGSYYFYRAFRVAFPDGSKWLFMVLIFFFPTILYWPSAIGKDALMSLSLGLFAYGGAQLIQNRRRALIPMALGFMGALWVRPHIAAISALALALAFFLPGGKKRSLHPSVYITGLIAVAGMSWYLLPRVMSFLNLEQLSSSGIIDYLLQFQRGSGGSGGSVFQGFSLYNPVSYIMGPVAVLFRPFPWEAHNLQALLESLAQMLVLFLILWRIKSLGRAIVSSITNAYSRYVLIYSIIFVLIFTAIVNFGTLARERVMLQPFIFMLLSYAPLRSTLKNESNQPETFRPTAITSPARPVSDATPPS